MPTTMTTLVPPAGYRFMFGHEADRLAYADPVVLWNGELVHGSVCACTDEFTKVLLRSGVIVTLDIDVPEYWPEGQSRDRKPPTSIDGEFVALHEVLATPDEEVEPLLRTSVALASMAKNDPELAEAIANVRRIVLNRLRNRQAA